MYKALKYVQEAPAIDVAKELVKHFKGSDLTATATSLENYKSVDTWMSNMSLPESMYNTLISIIENAGESTDNVTYQKIAYNDISSKVYNELYG